MDRNEVGQEGKEHIEPSFSSSLFPAPAGRNVQVLHSGTVGTIAPSLGAELWVGVGGGGWTLH